MPIGADPVIYATFLSSVSGMQNISGGVDYTLLVLVQSFTGASFGVNGCFFILHMLHVPFLYLLYRTSNCVQGMFFLLVGWMLFINSGVLLLGNFFRQGISVMLFLGVLIAFSVSSKHKISRICGALALPLFHLAAAALIPSLFTCKKRHYYWFSAFFLLFCLAIRLGVGNIAIHFSDYFEVDDGTLQKQLWIKVMATYLILALGYCIHNRTSESTAVITRIRRAALGFLLPTAALLLTANAPVIGLRFLYYSHAVAFLYVAACVGDRAKDTMFKGCALGLCSCGLITWTYPTVARLLVW